MGVLQVLFWHFCGHFHKLYTGIFTGHFYGIFGEVAIGVFKYLLRRFHGIFTVVYAVILWAF
jgi:hypothetical protein